MKYDDGAYYGFEKDVCVYESVDCNSAETEADTYDQYIGAQLWLPHKYGMKQMEGLLQILRNVYGNPGGTGIYRYWLDHTEY